MTQPVASLLPPSATSLERAVGAVIAPAVDPLVLRGLSDSARIPAAVLPWLAWASSTDGWEEALTESTRRELVRRSVEIHQRKGTAGAIRRVLGAIGASVELAEWQQTGGAPYTFTLTVWAGSDPAAGAAGIVNLELYARIRRMVDAVKNERSHYELMVGARFEQVLLIASATSAVAPIRAALDVVAVQPGISNQPLRMASAVHSFAVVRVCMEPA